MDLKLPREVLEWVNCRRGGKAQQVFIIECLLLLKRMERAGLGVVDCAETKMKDE
jgi:hypothetical protein